MAEVHDQLIVAAFASPSGAAEAFEQLRAAGKEMQSGIRGAVILSKDEHGAIHSKDIGASPGKSAAGGLAAGVVVGLLTGGTGLVLGAAGALVGAITARKRRDQRFAPKTINEVAVELKTGTSGLVVLVAVEQSASIEQELTRLGGEVVTASIDPELAARLAPAPPQPGEPPIESGE